MCQVCTGCRDEKETNQPVSRAHRQEQTWPSRASLNNSEQLHFGMGPSMPSTIATWEDNEGQKHTGSQDLAFTLNPKGFCTYCFLYLSDLPPISTWLPPSSPPSLLKSVNLSMRSSLTIFTCTTTPNVAIRLSALFFSLFLSPC